MNRTSSLDRNLGQNEVSQPPDTVHVVPVDVAGGEIREVDLLGDKRPVGGICFSWDQSISATMKRSVTCWSLKGCTRRNPGWPSGASPS